MNKKIKKTGFLFARLYAFIPLYVSNITIIRVMNILRRLQLRGGAYAKAHIEKNKMALDKLKSSLPDLYSGRYIENQKSLGSLMLGKSDMAYAGCEVIAVYNALRSLEMTQVSLIGLIADFEKDGIIHGGKYGSAIGAVKDHLDRYGLKTVMTYKKDLMGRLMDESHVSILTMYNDRSTIGAQIHSICITRVETDSPPREVTVSGIDSESKAHVFYVHNLHGDGRVFGPYRDYDAMVGSLNDGRIGPIALIGINKRDKETETEI